MVESLDPSSPEICPEMFSYRSQQASFSRAHQYGLHFLLLATRHLLSARSNFPCTCCLQFSGRMLSPPGISEHRKQSPQKMCKPFEARFGELHHVLREEWPPLEGTLFKILEEWILKTVREHHLASADLSCSLSSEGWASFLKQWVFGKLASGYQCVYGHIHQLPEAWGGNWFWTHSLVNTDILLQHLFLKMFYQFVLLSRQFGFTMNRTTWASSLLASLTLVNPKGSRAEFSWQVRTLHSSPSKSSARHLRSFRIAVGWASQSLSPQLSWLSSVWKEFYSIDHKHQQPAARLLGSAS